MQPMQPFQMTPMPTVKQPPLPLPGPLKLLLGLKALVCLIVIFVSYLSLQALSETQIGPEAAHVATVLLGLTTGAAFVTLLGIGGVWSFKRWGVYILAFATMLGFVFELRMTGVTLWSVLSLVMTAFAGIPIAARWKSFD
jgi:hypothetical protein